MKALLIALLSLASVSSFAANFNCVGTEPFWSLEVSSEYVRMSSPDINEGRGYESYKVVSSAIPAGMGELGGLLVKTKYTTAAIAAGTCTDGMSDEAYTHTIIFDRGDMVMAGCCNVAE